jgi:glycosyltransferase involved in cell wall biosynthesis
VARLPEIAVIVPSHRSEATIGACLDGLRGQTLAPERFEVHVVDTGEDGTAAVVGARADAWNGQLHYHAVEGGGPGEHRNFGAEQATARFLAFTDADCVPDPEWLAAGLSCLERGAAIVQGPTLTPDGSDPPPFSHAIAIPGPTPLFESCNVMYEGRAFKQAAGFPVDLFELTGSPFGEDAVLAWRVRRSGGRAAFEPGARVRHLVFPADFSRHLRYQWQVRYFPHLIRQVPELRRELLTAGVLLGPRSARLCGAIAGVLLGRRHRAAYLLAAPYALHLGRISRRARSPSAAAIGAGRHLIADVVREAGLISGSARFRSLVL